MTTDNLCVLHCREYYVESIYNDEVQHVDVHNLLLHNYKIYCKTAKVSSRRVHQPAKSANVRSGRNAESSQSLNFFSMSRTIREYSWMTSDKEFRTNFSSVSANPKRNERRQSC